MSKFSNRLKKAKAAPRPQKELRVLIDPDLIRQRDELVAQLQALPAIDADDERLAEADPNQVERDRIIEEMAGLDHEHQESLVTLRITKAEGSEWSAVSAMYPPRKGVRVDDNWGINIHELVRREGRRWIVYLEDGEPKEFVYDEGTGDYPATDEWSDLCEVASGDDFVRIVDAVFSLNVWEPHQRRESLGKVLGSKSA